MTPQEYNLLRAKFFEVIERPPSEWAEAVNTLCHDTPALRTELESLLKHAAGSTEAIKNAVFADATEPAVLPARIGQYRVIRQIGQGGMGVVFEVQQDHPQRTVALKLLRSGVASPTQFRRFEHEAHILGLLQHPCIAQVYDAGTADLGIGPQPYFAMEYVRGVPLTEYARTNELTTRQRLQLFTQVGDGVHHAHQKAVVHRDLKPDNILVDADGHVKILDFGVARITDADVGRITLQTGLGQLIGTVWYMSPEQAGGNPNDVDVRSDVYSMGVVLYELLADRLPYDVQNLMVHEVVRAVREDEPARLSSINRICRGDLDAIVTRALEKDRERRYQSAHDMVSDVRRYLDDQPIMARPPTGMYQFRKLVARNKLPFALGSTFVLVLMGFSIWMSALYARTLSAEQLAQERLAQFATARDEAEAETDRANTATRLAETRLAEANQSRADLDVVAEFQANMLGSIDAQQLGYNVLAGLRARMELVLLSADMPRAQITDTLSSLDLLLGRLNRADIGEALLHDNILRGATAAISENFTDQPLVAARLRSTIGKVYQSLGDYARAEPNLRIAREIRLRVLNADDPDTMRSSCDLGILYHAQARYEEAEDLLLETVDRYRKVLGQEHTETLDCVHSLGDVLVSQGRYSDVEPLWTATLETRQRILGAEHPDTLRSMSDLALVYKLQGKHDKAEEGFKQALELQRRVLGEQSTVTQATMHNLAKLYTDQKRNGLAETLFVEVLDLRRKTLGSDHPKTLATMTELAWMYRWQGRLDKAVALQVEALENQRRVLGDDHPDTLLTISYLADFHQTRGQVDEAERLNIKALEGRRRTLGDEHPSTLASLNQLAAHYMYGARHAEAEPLLVEALQISRRTLGETHQSTLSLMHDLGVVYNTQRRYSEAEPLAAAVAEIASKTMHDEDWMKGVYNLLHGEVLVNLERFDEAEVALLETRRVFEIAFGPTHSGTVKSYHRLMRLYEAWGKPDAAAEYRARLPGDIRARAEHAAAKRHAKGSDSQNTEE